MHYPQRIVHVALCLHHTCAASPSALPCLCSCYTSRSPAFAYDCNNISSYGLRSSELSALDRLSEQLHRQTLTLQVSEKPSLATYPSFSYQPHFLPPCLVSFKHASHLVQAHFSFSTPCRQPSCCTRLLLSPFFLLVCRNHPAGNQWARQNPGPTRLGWQGAPHTGVVTFQRTSLCSQCSWMTQQVRGLGNWCGGAGAMWIPKEQQWAVAKRKGEWLDEWLFWMCPIAQQARPLSHSLQPEPHLCQFSLTLEGQEGQEGGGADGWMGWDEVPGNLSMLSTSVAPVLALLLTLVLTFAGPCVLTLVCSHCAHTVLPICSCRVLPFLRDHGANGRVHT